jgi:hypothetical protein
MPAYRRSIASGGCHFVPPTLQRWEHNMDQVVHDRGRSWQSVTPGMFLKAVGGGGGALTSCGGGAGKGGLGPGSCVC